ncbi:transcriptional repressor LexA [Planctomycetota bacterium]
MESLTEKQKQVLQFIENRLRVGKPPSQREMAEHFDLARNAICQLLDYLKKKDYLEDLGGHRGLRLSKEYLAMKKETEGIPIVGRVAAGEPILAVDNIEGYVDFKEFFRPSEKAFILKVTGDSMVDEGIMNGDCVIVEPTSTIENGQIGVVLLDDEVTVKKIYFQPNKIALKPSNRAKSYETIYIKKRGDKNVRLVGKVKGCFRVL